MPGWRCSRPKRASGKTRRLVPFALIVDGKTRALMVIELAELDTQSERTRVITSGAP